MYRYHPWLKPLMAIFLASVFTGYIHAGFARPSIIPAPPTIGATAHILIDANSGYVIASNNADVIIPPASLTKMMTDYVIQYELAQGNISMDDEILISETAWKAPGSRMYLDVNSKVSIDKILQGIVVQSGNDACIAIAEHIAGSESAFADLMNQHAKLLGMKNSNFRNATGLPDPNHYTTAEDLTILARALINTFPEHYAIYSQKEFEYNNIKQPNRNLLLWRDASVDGIKTGHTEEAGFCLVASAKQNEMRLISVVLGTNSETERAKQSQTLLSYGFRFHESHKVYDANETLNDADIWKASSSTIKIGVEKSVYVTIPKNKAEDVSAALNINTPIIAPIKRGQQLGTVELKLKEKLLMQQPVYALESVEEAGFLKNIWHDFLLLF